MFWIDVRNGCVIPVCEVAFGEYADMSAFHAGRKFYQRLCDCAVFVPKPAHGSNNLCLWKEFSRGNCGRCAPDRADVRRAGKPAVHGDRRRLAGEPRDGLLDVFNCARWPKKLTHKIVHEWGYRLIKYGSPHDIFDWYGIWRKQQMCDDGWHFHDCGRTTAEITMEYYCTIRQAAGEDCVIIGCNTIGHLVAGYAHLNRVGCDTSGSDWEDTRCFGVNSLAFRMLYRRIFHDIDADCVGIMGKIDWKYNAQWLKLLSMSGTPLFVS